jgi:hypothetical protein
LTGRPPKKSTPPAASSTRQIATFKPGVPSRIVIADHQEGRRRAGGPAIASAGGRDCRFFEPRADTPCTTSSRTPLPPDPARRIAQTSPTIPLLPTKPPPPLFHNHLPGGGRGAIKQAPRPSGARWPCTPARAPGAARSLVGGAGRIIFDWGSSRSRACPPPPLES